MSPRALLARLLHRRRTIRLRPAHELDAVMREHVETTRFVDEDGRLYEPAAEDIPAIQGWGDADGEHDGVR